MKGSNWLMVAVAFSALSLITASSVLASGKAPVDAEPFPRSLDSYGDENQASIMAILSNRIQQEPFNLYPSKYVGTRIYGQP